MPYKLKQTGAGYKVCKKTGNKCFSKEPLTKERAKKQMAAIYANESFDQAIYRILREFTDTTSSTNRYGSTTTTPVQQQNLTGSLKSPDPNNPTDVKNVCQGLDPANKMHVDDVVNKFKTHPEWSKLKTQAGKTDQDLAKDMIQTNNPATLQPNKQNTPPLNKPIQASNSVPVSPPSTTPSI